MKFKTKIILSYVSIFLLVFLMAGIITARVKSSRGDAKFIKDRVSVSIFEANELKVDIIQIQQWLTDVSATGYLDGLDKAEGFFKAANRLLDRDIKRKQDLGKNDLEKRLQSIKLQLKNYYEIGVRMAHQYAENGRDAGNVWMDKFDPVAEKLGKMVDGQIQGYSKVFNGKMEDFLKNLVDIFTTLIVLGSLIGVFILIMAFFVSRSFNSGVNLVSGFADKMAVNDMSATIAVKRKDEFGILAKQFKDGFAVINGVLEKVAESAASTSEVKDSLVAASGETSATLKNIKNRTSALGRETEEMKSNVEENVASIEEITANINGINNQISEQAAMVEESTASVTEMMSSLESMDSITVKKGEAVASLVNVAGEGASTVSGMAEDFKTNVAAKIEGISEMADTIQKISSQTNLLSMNAAIEAAHAGDAGKGFAVVADEIRKLADTSSRSSSNITSLIKEISEGVAATEVKTRKSFEAFTLIYKGIDETKKAFDEIAASSRELSAGGKQIMDAMTVLQEVTTSVKGASEEISTGTESIVRGQLGLKDLSDSVAKGMAEIEGGTEEISSAAEEIAGHSTLLNNVVSVLKEEIDKFTI